MSTGNQFKDSGYIVMAGLIPQDEAKKLYDYTVANAELGNKDDGQVPGSPSFYQDKEVVALQKKLLPTIAKSINVPLLNVFCYHRVYRKGAILRTHKDSIRAEISVTLNLGQQGEPWDLWLMNYDEQATKVTLLPGDALIYKGSELPHWRAKLENADYVSQVMFHCVDKNGKHTSAVLWESLRKLRKKCRELFGIVY